MITKLFFRSLPKGYFSSITSAITTRFLKHREYQVINPSEIEFYTSEQFRQFIKVWDGSPQYYEPTIKRLKQCEDFNYQIEYDQALKLLYKAFQQGAVENLQFVHNIAQLDSSCSVRNYHALWLAYGVNCLIKNSTKLNLNMQITINFLDI